jgi:hypothetical protein
METLAIRNPSLGGYSTELQEAILQGFRVSVEPSEYPNLDNQFNAVLRRSDSAAEPSTEQQASEEAQPTKKLAGRPPRKL